MDLLTWLFVIAFEGAIGLLAVMSTATYISFLHMDKDVRRARMFIMADRIKRFLGAFTLGFVALAAAFAGAIAGVSPPAVTTGAFFFFLGTIGYGVVELYLVVRPRRSINGRRFRFSPSAIGRKPSVSASSNSPSEVDKDAAE